MNKIMFLIFMLVFNACGNIQEKEKIAPAKSGQPLVTKVACVGDSITEGVGISSPEATYPSRLSELLGEGWDVRNFGVKSTTLLKMGSKPYWNTSAFQESHAFNPDIVVIMLGTNDMKNGNWANIKHYVSNYTELIRTYKVLPSQPKVYVCIPPSIRKSKNGISNSRLVNGLIPRILEASKIESVETIDFYHSFVGRKGLIGDNVHPNDKGALFIANEVYNKIY